MAKPDSDTPTAGSADPVNPVIAEIKAYETHSVVAVVGHPIHAMMIHFPIAFAIATLGADILYWYGGDIFWPRVAVWSAGLAFVSAAAAGIAGTAELLLVKGIRLRVASWTHAIAAMTFIAIVGTNWGLRLGDPLAALPHGLGLSLLSSVFAGFAGWHGGKLIFDHGIGIMVSPQK
jgi:uncharacterized membrane protein